MTHCSKIVNLVWFDLSDQCDEVGGIAKITIVEEELDARVMTVPVEVINATGVEARGSTDDTMDLFVCDEDSTSVSTRDS